MMDIGVKYFSSIMVDMKGGQSRLAQKYLHCEVAHPAADHEVPLHAASVHCQYACASFVKGRSWSCFRRQCCGG